MARAAVPGAKVETGRKSETLRKVETVSKVARHRARNLNGLIIFRCDKLTLNLSAQVISIVGI